MDDTLLEGASTSVHFVVVGGRAGRNVRRGKRQTNFARGIAARRSKFESTSDANKHPEPGWRRVQATTRGIRLAALRHARIRGNG